MKHTRILVTVGTSSFDNLLMAIDSISLDGFYFDVQTGSSSYNVINHNSFKWANKLSDLYIDYDLVITHAGAGTIYNLLERGVRFISVPNLERVDKHQDDICKFIEKNNYALVCYNLCDLYNMIASYDFEKFEFNSYKKNEFFKVDEILDEIK
ncbi:glycosyltransferase [Vibrio tarriae]|uniref:PssE/Cps14G family polysaccharide biosynthesis glycosyltransferase n=1 Tax=Vibrio tarriae TaxID=2014742 RepID=UPI000DE51095|nr:PssE/Cps14G family polysaccharide biosynthesis glycosyltransferase [Vibrio tarriae]RBM46827.1 glycosyltransferase [Vibrio tarriae]